MLSLNWTQIFTDIRRKEFHCKGIQGRGATIQNESFILDSNRMREKSFVVIARSSFATKQSDNLLKSLKARLLRYARNDRALDFSASW
jgi:hypothetical protein